jgi:hypothetical protein
MEKFKSLIEEQILYEIAIVSHTMENDRIVHQLLAHN